MPKKVRITREQVLRAAAEVVREEGSENLNARSVAKMLGCSTQPVYSLFGNMDSLREALSEEGKAQYHKFIEDYFRIAGRSRYECFGMGFVKFAQEERGLFRYLFMRGKGTDPFWQEIIGEMMTCYHMTENEAQAFHRDMSVFSYGLAVLANLSEGGISDEETSSALKREFYGLYALYFPNRPRLNRDGGVL